MKKNLESNEAFLERMIKEFDTWQDGKKKERVALVVIQDETGKTSVECFGDNRGKSPLLRFIGRMVGVVACSPSGSWFKAISSSFFKSARGRSLRVAMLQPISKGLDMIHHIPKCVLSSSSDIERPTSSISMSL